MKNLKINLNCLVKAATLLLIIAALLVLIVTGKIQLYLHPKMFVFLYVALVFLALMFFSLLPQLFKEGREGLKPVYLAFIIPILLGLGSAPGALEQNVSEKKGVMVSKDTTLYSQNEAEIGSEKSGNANLPSAKEGKALVLNSDNFLSVLDQLFEEPDKFVGNRLIISGFAYKADSFNEGQFAIARLTISCCAADAAMVGLFCSGGELSSFEDEKWYEVDGVLSTTKMGERTIPLLEITGAKAIEKPENVYVYQTPQ